MKFTSLLACVLFASKVSPLPAQNWTNFPLVTNPQPADTFLIGTTTNNEQLSAQAMLHWLAGAGLGGSSSNGVTTNWVISYADTNGAGVAAANAATNALQIPTTNGFVTASVTNGLATTNYVNAATNGFVTSSVTNGLATTNYVNAATNGFVTSSVTNGLATGSYLQKRLATNYLAPDVAKLIVQAREGLATNVFFVATNGSDSNPGSAAFPFQTITHAYNTAAHAGNVILVNPGVYTDFVSGDGLDFGRAGASGAPITIESIVPHGAVIDGQYNSNFLYGIYLDGNYEIVKGFKIERSWGMGIYCDAAECMILGNEIANCGSDYPTNSTDGEGGVFTGQGCSNNIIAGNYIHDNGRLNVRKTLDHGIYSCGQQEQIFDNICVSNAGCGIQIAGYVSITNDLLFNNVCGWNVASGITFWQAFSSCYVFNNVFIDNAGTGIHASAATGGGLVLGYNVTFGNNPNVNLTDNGSTVTYTNATGAYSTEDPQFVNEAWPGLDAHLMSNSPDIGIGNNYFSLWPFDFDGAARPSSGGWDLGAYIYTP